MSSFLWTADQTIVMTGDSITDCGRREDPIGLGHGYVRQVVHLVRARYPERLLNVVNTGISGNCTDDLLGRWQTDVLAYKPDWVTVMIGINDLHRDLDGVKQLPPPVYEANLRQLSQQVLDSGARLVLIDPFYMLLSMNADARQSEVLVRLEDYIDAVDAVASDLGALHVRTQAVWDAVLPAYPCQLWGNEPVHPNADGHLVLASALLEVLGY